MDHGVTVVKFGGSAITNKDVAFSYRKEVVADLGHVLAATKEKVVLVHGGGSFGHVLAKKYGLSSSKTSPSPRGVSETREVMFRLDVSVCTTLTRAGIHPYTFAPYTLLRACGPAAAPFLRKLIAGGLTPVTFGDVLQEPRGFRILSGDVICRELCSLLDAKRCIMVLDVNGVMDHSGKMMRVMDEGAARRFTASRGTDTTGGIRGKIKEAAKIASSGCEVRFVSGFRPEEFAKALRGEKFDGTLMRAVAPVPQPLAAR